MSPRFGRSLGLLGALLIFSSGTRADDPASPAMGTVRLASGQLAHYAYHHDRNALADAVVVDDSIVAIGGSGALLRFDRDSLAWKKEHIERSASTCLGRGADGSVLAGFDDGRIAHVDPAALQIREVAKVPGKVQWVGAWADRPGAKPRIVAVVERVGQVEDRGRTYPVRSSVVHDLGSGRTFAIESKEDPPQPRRASAFLLDQKHRLWLGADNGEWGGWCICVDLGAGQVREIPGLRIYDFSPDPAWLGVMGFTELRDGQVWAHGGTTHMGDTEGFLWRVDRGRAEELYRLDNYPDNLEAFARKQRERQARGEKVDDDEQRPEPDPLPTDRPYLPITHVVEAPGADGLIVVAFSGVYRTDIKLSRWSKVHELEIRYRWGRPDAMGAYPSVRAVLPIPGPGKVPGLIFATAIDGLIRLVDGKQTDHALPGQIGIEEVSRLANSSEGLLVLGGSSDGEAWRLRGGEWGSVSFTPKFESADPNEKDFETEGWHSSTVLVGRDGSIVTVSASPVMPGTRAVARWKNGKAEVVGREVSMRAGESCFLTPDGGIWSADSTSGNGPQKPTIVSLQRLVDGRWIDAFSSEWTSDVGSRRPGIGWDLRAMHDDGPPWILLDPRNEVLLRLSYGVNFQDPRLSVVTTEEAGKRLKIRDAIPSEKGRMLLATDRGLRSFSIDGGRIEAGGIEAGRDITRLARDGIGRFWLGGEGLILVEGGKLQPMDELPMLGRSKIAAMAADPDHREGVVAAIEGRGVVFVRVEGR